MKTVITHPDGSRTAIEQHGSIAAGCSWAFWFLLGPSSLLAPATWFPVWGALLAYGVEATVVVVALRARMTGRPDNRPPSD